jgi:hypothetical protein
MLRYFDQDVFHLGQGGPGDPFGQGGLKQVVRCESVRVFRRW